MKQTQAVDRRLVKQEEPFAGLDALPRYRRLYAPGADVEAVNDDFYATVEAHVAGPLVVSRRVLQNSRQSRPPERVARDAFDHITLSFVHSGQIELRTERRNQVVRAGGVYFFAMTRAMSFVAHAELTTVSLPRHIFPDLPWIPGGLHGFSFAGSATAPLVRWLQASSRAPNAGPMLAAGLSAALQAELGVARPARTPEPDAQDQVRVLIEARIADQTLSPERIADSLGVSRATLYRSFEPLGSIQRWRQGRRLQRFKAALAFTDLSIGAAARLVGLENPAHASASFSRVYGVSPGQFRKRALDGLPEAEKGNDLTWIYENIPIITLRNLILNGRS